MRLLLIYSFLFLFQGCGQQQKVSKLQRSDVPDEGANKYTQPFSLDDYYNPVSAASAGDIKMQEVTAENLKDLIRQSDYTWIAVWASWCPHCQAGIREYHKTAEQLEGKGLRYVMLSEDYNLPAIQQLVFESGYRRQTYVLDPKTFGYDEAAKVGNLRKAICPSCVDKDAVVPQHYIFNRFGKQILYTVGGDLDKQTIERAIWVDQGMKTDE